jgi:hypothetical protein
MHNKTLSFLLNRLRNFGNRATDLDTSWLEYGCQLQNLGKLSLKTAVLRKEAGEGKQWAVIEGV